MHGDIDFAEHSEELCYDIRTLVEAFSDYVTVGLLDFSEACAAVEGVYELRF